MDRKIKTSIALDPDLLAWFDEMIQQKRFASRTHGIEYCLQRVRENQQTELHISEDDAEEETGYIMGQTNLEA